MANNAQDNVNLAQGAPTVAVGHSLRTARELTGKTIAEVALLLRIREPFLQALEDGRHKDLPGGTYAVGFLRTYADFLGLDGEEMVRRFRAEAAGELDVRLNLAFPSPVSEGRIPGGAVLFLGLMLAGIAYGGWYLLSARQTQVAEMVPPLPDRLASVFSRQATLTGEPAKPVEAAPKPDETQAKSAEEPAAPAAMNGKDNDVVPPSEGEDEAKAVAPAPAPAVVAPPVVAEPVKTVVAKVEPPKVEAVKVEPAKVEPAKVEPAPLPAVSAPVPEGKVVGQDNADSRVQLKAIADDCWVQVRELDGQLLLSRLLRRGDSYMVPNRPGLTLMVGNAGALDIMVDGKKAPALGNAGQVRRDIKLDPDKLLGGG
ncbi:MAG: DUF4115 domain-containing protein [Rhodospirillaceae bacterium]|nr:DUF4115 domain-containing protein [Rhodospirillales bacterium]